MGKVMEARACGEREVVRLVGEVWWHGEERWRLVSVVGRWLRRG